MYKSEYNNNSCALLHYFIIVGESCVFMLDAEKCATEFRSTIADDITMRQTLEDLYSCAAYEKGRL